MNNTSVSGMLTDVVANVKMLKISAYKATNEISELLRFSATKKKCIYTYIKVYTLSTIKRYV